LSMWCDLRTPLICEQDLSSSPHDFARAGLGRSNTQPCWLLLRLYFYAHTLYYV